MSCTPLRPSPQSAMPALRPSPQSVMPGWPVVNRDTGQAKSPDALRKQSRPISHARLLAPPEYVLRACLYEGAFSDFVSSYSLPQVNPGLRRKRPIRHSAGQSCAPTASCVRASRWFEQDFSRRDQTCVLAVAVPSTLPLVLPFVVLMLVLSLQITFTDESAMSSG